MKQSIAPKVGVSNTLSNTLKSWLPLLQANINDLEKLIKKTGGDNPFIEVENGFEERDKKTKKQVYEPHYQKYSTHETIEKLTIEKENFYDKLFSQIENKLFPTPMSEQIAYKIIDNINDEGYFDGDLEEIAEELETTSLMVEKVRQRFAHLEPYGVGSVDYKESFIFQLEHFDLDDTPEVYDCCKMLIENLEDVHKFKKHRYYKEAITVIKKFKNPPRLDYMSEDIPIIADILIYTDEDNNIDVSLNNSYYPTLRIEAEGLNTSDDFVKTKIKEANSIVNALSMRKSTLLKVANLIVENQYDFFLGGVIKPMKLKDIASELGYNQSTISRAISDKYISCNRGLFTIKSFFTTSLDEETDVSNQSIKDFIDELIKHEDKNKPYSDEKLREKILEKFQINIVRRTVTKYRKQLNIGSSPERKKYLYL